MNPRQKQHADRFVAMRTGTSFNYFASSTHQLSTGYARLLEEPSRRCLSFSKHKSNSTTVSSRDSSMCSPQNRVEVGGRIRKIDRGFVQAIDAYQIIYAPDVADNYYGQRLDWSVKGVLSIGIEGNCYLYSNQTINRISFSNSFLEDYSITSLRFNSQGTLLYLGDSRGELSVIDLYKLVEVRSFAPHASRIGCIQNSFEWGLLTGSKDCSVAHHDLRACNPIVMKLVAHKHEVCGLTVQNGRVASGGNDGTVMLWDLTNSSKFERQKFHTGAVKAMQWCPWRANLLATGGGSKDHKVILWNAETQEVQEVLEGKSQITGLAWRSSARDLVSTHGGTAKESYGMIWSSKIKEFTHLLTGHQKRIVGVAISPLDHSQICTLGADETMRFWQTKRDATLALPTSKSALSTVSLK